MTKPQYYSKTFVFYIDVKRDGSRGHGVCVQVPEIWLKLWRKQAVDMGCKIIAIYRVKA